MAEPHERLDDAMNTRRIELRMKWNEVANTAGVSSEALRAIRRGDYRPSQITARDLDRALQWEQGSVERILQGGDPRPILSPAEAYLEEFRDDPEFVALLKRLPRRRRQRALEEWAEARERARESWMRMVRLAAEDLQDEDTDAREAN